MTRNALIFAGAGASKAVSSDRFPTTVEFFAKLPSEILEKPLFQLADAYLRKDDQNRVIDIEEILWEFQGLNRFCTAFSGQSSFVGYGLSTDQFVSRFMSNGHNTGHLKSLIPTLKGQAEALIGQINAIVYDFYSFEPEESDLKGNWMALMSALEGKSFNYNVFTTNYDLSIEAAAFAFDPVNFDGFRGTKGNINKRIDLSLWRDGVPTRQCLLTKLHGSINWKWSGDEIFVGDGLYTGDHKKHAIIYPGFKGLSANKFFDPFHSYLGESLASADIALFVGFAFRDDHINDIIADRLNPNCKVVVINPDKRIRFPLKRVKVQHLSSGFDSASVKAALDGV